MLARAGKRRGAEPRRNIVEPTSGNTPDWRGFGGGGDGFKAILVFAREYEALSARKMMAILGAELSAHARSGRYSGAMAPSRRESLASDTRAAVRAGQFSTILAIRRIQLCNNWPEIWEDCAGEG